MYLTSLKDIPSVNKVLEGFNNKNSLHEDYLKFIIKKEIENFRLKIIKEELFKTKIELFNCIKKNILKKINYSLVNIINGTGIVLHTGFGRAPFNSSLLIKIAKRIEGYTNLEFNLESGIRGDRQNHIKDHLSSICGSESGMIVNNNAGAVMLAINEIAQGGGEVICSRGQLVEIGGSFRIPDIINKSGAILKEVGTTNRTHFYDYENAITSKTKLLLQVHTSNYVVKGYSKSVKLLDLIKLGKKYDIPVMVDWGSGAFLDMKKYNVLREIPIKSILKNGPDLVTFSGDKLIGGPQSGLIVGKKKLIDLLKKNTLYRTLRCNKITIALFEEVLRTYRIDLFKNENLSMVLLTRTQKELREIGIHIFNSIKEEQINNFNIKLVKSLVEAGSGSLPEEKIKSMAFSFKHKNKSATELAFNFRNSYYPVVGYISNDIFFIDLKAVIPNQIPKLIKSINKL